MVSLVHVLAMLQIKPKGDGRAPPAVDHSTTTSPSKATDPTSEKSMGAVLVFVARAGNLRDHEWGFVPLNPLQMHHYLRSLLVMASLQHRRVYTNLGDRPHKIQTIIHPANGKQSLTCRTNKYLSAALEDARAINAECIFVLYNWDGWTTDYDTIIELCELNKDVPLTLHIYAKGHNQSREFYEANAHKAAAHFRFRGSLDEESIAQDRNTALFIRMIDVLHKLHYEIPIPPDTKRELSRYDSRLF